MKTLKTIQVLAKIARVVSKIVFICSLVGFCLCIAGIAGLAFGAGALKIGGVTLHGLIEEHASIGSASLYAAAATGAVFCAAEAILSKIAERYFKNEVAAGTPFTFDGAKELTRLGVFAIVIPVCATAVCSIGLSLFSMAYPELNNLSLNGFSSVGLGIAFLIFSLFCRCGAEMEDNYKHPEM